MPNDMSTAAISHASQYYDAGVSLQQPAATPATPETGTTPVPVGTPNPTIQLDPSLNVVVIQLHDRAGDVTVSIPTVRHLEAYRIGLLPVPGTTPPVVPAAPAAPAQSTSQQPVTPTPSPAPATPSLPHLAPAPVAAAAAPSLPGSSTAAPSVPAVGVPAATPAPAPLPAAPAVSAAGTHIA